MVAVHALPARRSSRRLLLRNVEVRGRPVDVTVAGGVVAEVDPRGGGRTRGTTVIDGAGGALVPGLHDHHLHLMSLAAARQSVDGSGDLVEALRRAAGRTPAGEWLRVVGHHDRDQLTLDRWALDAVVGGRPVRVQHRSGACWVLSTAALGAVGLLWGDRRPEGVEVDERGEPTGRLFGLDGWLASRVARPALDLASLGRDLVARGVTGFTDATPADSLTDLAPLLDAVADGALPQRVVVTGAPGLDVAPADLPAGVEVGPAKILPADHRLPSLADLAAAVAAARRRGRRVAVHCVTREALVLTLTALDEAGGGRAGDRIEHGAVVPPELYAALHRHHLTVVTQPNLVAERGDDYLAEVEPADRPHLWPAASLLAAGVEVAAGTDAPFGDPDPWALVAAATTRRTRSGAVLGPEERLTPRRALDLLLGRPDRPGGPPRRVAAGQVADLCLLATGWVAARRSLPDVRVRATIVDGEVHHLTDSQ